MRFSAKWRWRNRRGEKFDYTTHEKLKEAIEKQLFEERRDTIKLTITSRNPDTEQLRKLNEVVETLVTPRRLLHRVCQRTVQICQQPAGAGEIAWHLPWELRRRGLKDSLRHDQRVKDAIRKNLRELIAEEAIITSDGQQAGADSAALSRSVPL